MVNTFIGTTCCFKIGYAMIVSGMQTSLGTCLVWVGIVIVPIECMSNFVANITSSSSSDIP
jgi:hypothetical protein